MERPLGLSQFMQHATIVDDRHFRLKDELHPRLSPSLVAFNGQPEGNFGLIVIVQVAMKFSVTKQNGVAQCFLASKVDAIRR